MTVTAIEPEFYFPVIGFGNTESLLIISRHEFLLKQGVVVEIADHEPRTCGRDLLEVY